MGGKYTGQDANIDRTGQENRQVNSQTPPPLSPTIFKGQNGDQSGCYEVFVVVVVVVHDTGGLNYHQSSNANTH